MTAINFMVDYPTTVLRMGYPCLDDCRLQVPCYNDANLVRARVWHAENGGAA